jgi:hypothetical protein
MRCGVEFTHIDGGLVLRELGGEVEVRRPQCGLPWALLQRDGYHTPSYVLGHVDVLVGRRLDVIVSIVPDTIMMRGATLALLIAIASVHCQLDWHTQQPVGVLINLCRPKNHSCLLLVVVVAHCADQLASTVTVDVDEHRCGQQVSIDQDMILTIEEGNLTDHPFGMHRDSAWLQRQQLCSALVKSRPSDCLVRPQLDDAGWSSTHGSECGWSNSSSSRLSSPNTSHEA